MSDLPPEPPIGSIVVTVGELAHLIAMSTPERPVRAGFLNGKVAADPWVVDALTVLREGPAS